MTETIDEIRQKDMVGSDQKAHKMWFFKRMGDGMIFSARETEAWNLLENRGNWMRRDFRNLGASDGTTYYKVIAESKDKGIDAKKEIDQLESELARYRKTEENMVFNDLVDPLGTDDAGAADREKLQKLRGIMKGYEDKLVDLYAFYGNITGNIVQQAFDAELAVAVQNTKERGRPEYPGNANIITPSASPKERRKIMRSMGQDDDE